MRTTRAWSGRARLMIAMGALSVTACQEQLSTGIRDSISAAPVTVEIELPWSSFGSDLETYGGYGVTPEVGAGFLARDFQGTLNANTLVRFRGYPDRTSVRDTTGTTRTDSALTYVGGRVVAFFDTIASTNTGPVQIKLGSTQQRWHPPTATWTMAIDTLGDSEAWGVPGGGPVVDYITATWDPAAGDTVLFQLDSAQLAAWADTTDLTRGAHLELVTASERLRIRGAALRLDARPSVNPDTTVRLNALSQTITFLYDPVPGPPPNGMRIGGTPSWRTVLDIGLPDQLTGPPEFCAQVACPHVIEENEVSFAALLVTSRAPDPAFQPTDSINLDVRPVLQRSALPKSPLGVSLFPSVLGRRLPATAFGTNPGQVIEIPITQFVRSLLAEGDPGAQPPNSLALLSVIEPGGITFASFEGPGGAGEPRLRLVLTIGAAVELP